jgi:L-fucose isomerase-like protein
MQSSDPDSVTFMLIRHLGSCRKRALVTSAILACEMLSRLNEQIALVPLASSLDDPKSVEHVISTYRGWLTGSFGCEIHPTSKFELDEDQRLRAAAGLLVLVVTGGTELQIQHIVASGKPTLIVAHESMNSVPAALEALSSILERNRPQLVIAKTDMDRERVRQFARAAKAFARISNYRLGLIGGPSPSLTYSLPDRKDLSRRLGIRLIDIPMDELRSAYDEVSETRVAQLATEARSKDSSSEQVKFEDFRRSGAIYIAIRKLAERHGLNAVSIKCFDLITDYEATGCLAVAKLNDENFVAGCEGDIPAATAMIILSEVSESPTFLANASFVEGRNLVLAHCTIAPRLTAEYRYRTHFESGLGVAIAGALKVGERVTILRLSKTLDRLRAGEGTVMRGEAWSEELCRTQVEIKMDGDAEEIKNNPLGNHHVVTYGEHVGTLKSLATFAGMDFEEI